MNDNRLIVAAAGSGKTTYLVQKALEIKDKNVLITTYTEANEDEIKKKIIELNRFIPDNITIKTWFSFLLEHGVRPYQCRVNADLFDKKIGFFLTSERSGKKYDPNGKVILIPNKKTGKKHPIYWSKKDGTRYFFTSDYRIFSDKISEFVIDCNSKAEKRVISRISRIYPYIFIDEVQDLAGYDLDIIKLLLHSQSSLILMGDPRQITYLTHQPKKNTSRSQGNKKNLNIQEYIEKHKLTNICPIDTESLKCSHRNNKSICDYSSLLFPEMEHSEPCNCSGCRKSNVYHEGIFLVKTADIESYCDDFNPIILKWKGAIMPAWNFGKSKGLTFDRVLIHPTHEIKSWIKNSSHNLKPSTRCKFYVAITRARYSVGIVYDFKPREKLHYLLKKYKDPCACLELL
ncbi:MAG: UvrD-helicase domain-containing protein [Candidatus Dojkabacteria bacterium]